MRQHPSRLRCLVQTSLLALGLAGLHNPTWAAGVSGQGTWESTLIGRDLDGNLATFEAYYDTSLNITWLADTSHAKTSGFDLDGLLNWSDANAWAAALNINGYTGWRLPTVTDVGNDGCQHSYAGGTDCGRNLDPSTGELAHMFYVTLGNKTFCDPALSTVVNCIGPQAGWDTMNSGDFIGLPATPFAAKIFWTATNYATLNGHAWDFHFHAAEQRFDPKSTFLDAWAVHSGDIGASPVPEPAAAWLLGAGLLGLIGVVRRGRAPGLAGRASAV